MNINKVKVGAACQAVFVVIACLGIFGLAVFGFIMMVVDHGWLGVLINVAVVAFVTCGAIGSKWGDK